MLYHFFFPSIIVRILENNNYAMFLNTGKEISAATENGGLTFQCGLWSVRFFNLYNANELFQGW